MRTNSIQWQQIFDRVQSIDTDQAKDFLSTAPTDTRQLVDVRRPEEYLKQHLPGALLLPLDRLIDGQGRLDPKTTVLVYCSNGERSLAAAQWLVGQGFSDVRYIKGGIERWMGRQVRGHFEMNLNLLREDAGFSDAFKLAYAMEEGLRQFYMALARETDDERFQKLYRRLAGFEVEHKAQLLQRYHTQQQPEAVQTEIETDWTHRLEGGGAADMVLIQTLAHTEATADVFALAIAFETQAFDFYCRLAYQATRPELRTFFLEMAEAEKEHLAFITEEMDRYLTDTTQRKGE
jgi:sulfur-carrier protein adenylyltransferase/sulfurtransferase